MMRSLSKLYFSKQIRVIALLVTGLITLFVPLNQAEADTSIPAPALLNPMSPDFEAQLARLHSEPFSSRIKYDEKVQYLAFQNEGSGRRSSDDADDQHSVDQKKADQEKADQEKADKKEADQQEEDMNGDSDSDSDSEQPKKNRFDPALVSRGKNFFQSSCTECHDAERSTNKRKSYGAWLGIVRRMAAKEDADIPSSQHVPIATYLASLNPANNGSANGDSSSNAGDDSANGANVEVNEPPYSIYGTLSGVYRGTDPAIENQGFFPDAWLGVEWRSQNNPVSGRVVACTSCHGNNNGLGVELVEAAATLDLVDFFSPCPPGKRSCALQAHLKAGRFVVPFGAYSSKVHPGSLRTVSPPLMYNMGRRVGSINPLQPVLPLPYSDEGVDLHLNREFCCDWNATFDAYAVNGLQNSGQRLFRFSRSYRDNNTNVAAGGRATVGNKLIRLGGSIASGELQNEGAAFQPYKLAGGDVTLRHQDWLRANYEYAMRTEASAAGAKSRVYGNVVEVEVLLTSQPKIYFLSRYDTLKHQGALGDLYTERFTYGFNWVLEGGSLLILNHEHWNLKNQSDVDILGIRWTMAF